MQSEKILKIFAYGAVGAAIAMMMAGTVVEKLNGPDAAAQAIYHHPVFFALWAVTAAAGMAYLLRCGGGRRPVVLLLHVALVLILAGALVTHRSGISGSLHLREGETLSAFEADDGQQKPLPFSIRLESFDIEYYPDSRMPSDYISVVTFLTAGDSGSSSGMTERGTGESPATISMNHIAKLGGYRFYQADYDEDGAGSILAVSHDPWGVGVTYAGYLLLLACMIAYFFERNSAFRAARAALRRREPNPRRKVWTVVLVAGSVTLLVLWLVKVFPKGNLMPVLRSPLLVIHVVPIILSYTLFALTTVLGVIGLLLPAAKSERLRNVSLSVLYPAVFLLTFGTFLGGVWANISWGNYWSWDPKETWALATLLIYSFPLHANALPVFRKPRFFHAFCIIAFLAVLVTYYGVNLLLGGIHSYA